jgi:hypothetical protein
LIQFEEYFPLCNLALILAVDSGYEYLLPEKYSMFSEAEEMDHRNLRNSNRI